MIVRRALGAVAVALLVAGTLTACQEKQCSGDGPTYRTRRAGHGIVHERCINHEWKQVS